MLLSSACAAKNFRNARIFSMCAKFKIPNRGIHISPQIVQQGIKTSKHSECESIRLNPINIQMLSAGLHRQIFGQEEPDVVDEETLNKVIAHLKAHDLWGRETSVLPDVNIDLPRLLGANINEHFKIIGSRFSQSYKDLLLRLSSCEIPALPKSWVLAPGWTRYDVDGNVEQVPFPEDTALVFDIEVCMQEGNYPTLATAASEKCWYLWCSERLASDQFSWSQGITISDLIPLETLAGQTKPSEGKDWETRLIVGHNVAFDRTYVKEQYLLEKTKLSFVDTMSLHICVSGLTGVQRAMSAASKKKTASGISMDLNGMPLGWSGISSLNSLADVYSLYCEGAVLEKEEREIFVSGSLADVKAQFQELATYCARDVQATHRVLKNVTPLFFQRFPHPITFAGLLEMCSAYLPINQNWERYLRDAQDTYADLQKELKLSLIHLANDACRLLHDSAYKDDPWLWDLDWSVQEIKFRKMVASSSATKKRRVKVKEEIKEDESEPLLQYEVDEDCDTSEKTEKNENGLNPTIRGIFESAAALRKIRPFLPGYPSWYRDLCDKTGQIPDDDWEPGPNLISSQMRCVPKLMQLTWDGYPLHYDAKHGWGYLVPDPLVKQFNNQKFPVKNLHRMILERKIESEACGSVSVESKKHTVECSGGNGIQRSNGNSRTDNKPTDSVGHYGIGPYDIGIEGCQFYRMPHKDGPHKRVGNPLSKDFLSKVEDGTLSSWGKGQADRALLLSKMLSYWKNSHNRILSQMAVWLNHEELPIAVTKHCNYDDSNKCGAILPRLIPAGTVTRRAVEPTWLTASNAYEDRVGSELKAMVQAPPGYHFVGADVDSQELWIAALLGDSQFVKIHGCTAFGWMTLQGKRAASTDMHSRTAKSVGITRNQAKVLNYARIYGAGKAFAQRLLMQFNHRFTPEEAKLKVKKIYSETKGTRKISDIYSTTDSEEAVVYDSDSKSPHRRAWIGGSESHMFNKLEDIALSSKPETPVLGCRISRALEPHAVDKNFMTSRVNWVVQSSAVDYLHLMLVCMKWLLEEFNIDGRFSICIHDEVRYLIKSDDRYRAALALHITNLLTRSFFTYNLGMKDLPQSVAFFSSVDVDHVLRKEVTMDAVTPSNPHGLKKRHGIPEGEALDVLQAIEKTGGSLNSH